MSTRPTTPLFLAGLALCALLVAWALPQDATERTPPARKAAASMEVLYLEYVTPDVKGTCALLAAAHGVTFSDPDPMLGNARTATLLPGGRIGVRAPMRETEEPVVRTYFRVKDIEAAVAAAAAKGAEIAMGPTPIPGQGRFAIYLMGGNEFGLWEQ